MCPMPGVAISLSGIFFVVKPPRSPVKAKSQYGRELRPDTYTALWKGQESPKRMKNVYKKKVLMSHVSADMEDEALGFEHTWSDWVGEEYSSRSCYLPSW
jgi:hypothetical protein